ncbi:MAG: hypothetical protein WC683_15095 [bacterium]
MSAIATFYASVYCNLRAKAAAGKLDDREKTVFPFIERVCQGERFPIPDDVFRYVQEQYEEPLVERERHDFEKNGLAKLRTKISGITGEGLNDISDERYQKEMAALKAESDEREERRKQIKLAANLPVISVTGARLREMTATALECMMAANEPPELFVRSGDIVRIDRTEEGLPIVRIMTESAVRGVLDRCANWVEVRMVGSNGKSAPKELVTMPPLAVVRDLIALGTWSLPTLAGIIETPTIREVDRKITPVGYDPESKFYYAPEPAFAVAPVPDAPSVADLREAVALLHEIIEDFPFADDAGRANTLAAMITAIIRPLIKGPVPMILFDKPQAGTGASLLAEVISIVATGRPAAMISSPKDDEEWNKRIISMLVAGRLVVTVDNVEGKLYAPALASLLTATFYQGRILGQSREVTLPHHSVWLVTGNNIQLGGDLPRRCYWVRMDAKMARPWQRENFKHPDLREWVRAERGRIVAAVLTIVKSWMLAGRPKAKKEPLVGSFEEWAKMLAGILEYAQVPGFLANSEEMYEQGDVDTEAWEGFLQTWFAKWQDASVTVSEITTFLQLSEKDAMAQSSIGDKVHVKPSDMFATLPDDLANVKIGTASFPRKMGRALAKKAGVRFPCGYMLVKGETQHHAVTWRVIEYEKVVKNDGGN